MIEKWLAKLGWVGALVILLTASVGLNAWQFIRAGSADGRCESKIGGMVADVDRKAGEREADSIRIGRDTAQEAGEAVQVIEKETVRYVDRIREVRIPVPAECDGPMPDGVQDALSDAARAADSSM